MQAAETLKILCGAGESLNGRLLLLDALRMDVRTVKLQRDPGCAVCAGR
jgi:adenylyltransferase/sulfurtransferase